MARWRPPRTHRYTLPTLKRFFGNLPNQQHEHPTALPNQVWVGDITYLKVGTVYRYLAVVLDRRTRVVVGWSSGHRKDVALTLRALNRAVSNQHPPRGLIFHSMKAESIHGRTFNEDGQLLSVLCGYIPFYNRSRIHSSLNDVSPATYEQQLALSSVST